MKYSIVEMEMKADVRLQTMIRRGDIFMAELPKGIGCEQGGRRPVVVIQNNIGNFRSHLVIVASVTGARKKPMPTHVPLGRAQGLSRPSLLLLESIYTIDKTRLAAVHRASAAGENFADGSCNSYQYRAVAACRL